MYGFMNAEDARSPVGSRRGQSKHLVLMEFCPASLERQWALIVGTFHFWLGSPWLKKPQKLLLHKLHAWGFSNLTTTVGKFRCQRHLCHVLCTLHVKGHSDYSPSITAHNCTVSDHQWSKALKLQIGCVSSSWFERLWISDRTFVIHITEMILWRMILEIAFWAVESVFHLLHWAIIGFKWNHQKLTWRKIFHVLQSGYWYSVFN